VRGVRTWSPGQPSLYRAVATLSCGGGQRDGCPDTETATFGVRSFSFDSSAGFVLNGQSVKLHGGCVHHDNGPLGSKAIGRAEERRVELLKANYLRMTTIPLLAAIMRWIIVTACTNPVPTV